MTTESSPGGDHEAPSPLETGWSSVTPVGDSLLRRYVVGFGEWLESSARAAGHPVLRTDDVVAVDERADQPMLNCAIVLRPLDAERAQSVSTSLRALYADGTGGPHVVFSPWPAAVPGLSVAGHPPVMLRVPIGVPEGAGRAVGLDVREVTTRELLGEYERVLLESFPIDGVAAEPPRAELHPSSLHVPGVRMFVGLVDGTAVAGATSIVAHGVNHIERVATVEQARGKGYGAAITWAATLVDPALPSMLIASDMGRPVYERMGYVALDRWTLLTGPR